MEGVLWEEQEQGRLLRFRRQAEPEQSGLCGDERGEQAGAAAVHGE